MKIAELDRFSRVPMDPDSTSILKNGLREKVSKTSLPERITRKFISDASAFQIQRRDLDCGNLYFHLFQEGGDFIYLRIRNDRDKSQAWGRVGDETIVTPDAKQGNRVWLSSQGPALSSH